MALVALSLDLEQPQATGELMAVLGSHTAPEPGGLGWAE